MTHKLRYLMLRLFQCLSLFHRSMRTMGEQRTSLFIKSARLDLRDFSFRKHENSPDSKPYI